MTPAEAAILQQILQKVGGIEAFIGLQKSEGLDFKEQCRQDAKNRELQRMAKRRLKNKTNGH